MLNQMKKVWKEQRGLTLIELLAVVVILGIIAAIAVPAIGNIIENQKLKTHKANAIMVLDAAKLYYLDNPEEVSKDVDLKTLAEANANNGKKYLDAIPINPETNQPYTNGTIKYNNGDLMITLEGAKLGKDKKEIKDMTRQDILKDGNK
ncbi:MULTISPECIES: type II secretion system protein [Aneurinibacillus]|nr:MULTISPECIES: prepilin-type N-terminal cleavage/methylation domain-containing protein [Aneurinibacillus]AMA72115.1 hypothetical protein ACH33_04125 [Aneurinibacillus sp. XH2]MED0736448.1 prepilin-type N-terminal cleavage/methylation domain-containing protein [Aneurinibacillus thermoaerophilus]